MNAANTPAAALFALPPTHLNLPLRCDPLSNIWLGLTVLIAFLWVFIIQNWIFLNLFSALLGQNECIFLD